MSREELTNLDREALIDLILALQAEVEALRLKLEKSQKPPTNSGNSSQPPSKDWKGNLPAKRRRRRHGPPLGHPKYERKWVAQPDQVVEVAPRVCHMCQSDLSREPMVLKNVNQITELPAAKAEVVEVRQYGVECPCCGQKQVGEPPVGLEMGRTFGARLEATVTYYHQEQHISYARIVAALRNLHGVEISQGGIDQIKQRAARQALKEVEPIAQELQQSAVIHSDETGSRVDGENWWQWVFCSVSAVLHVIRFNRSRDVIQDVMAGHEAEVWVSDCWPPQLQAPARQRQLCLAHQLRNLQAVVERYPLASWSRHMRVLFRYAIHLHHQRQQLSAQEFTKQVKRTENLLDKLLNHVLDQPEAQKLQRRYQKYRDAVFLFLRRMDVSPTNNLSEQRLRPSVIHRKVTGGFRSGWGAQGYAALKSIIDTAALAGVTPFDTIQSLFGTPSLPLRV